MRRTLLLLWLLLLPVALAAQTQEEQDRDRGFLTGLIEDNLSSVSRQVTILGFEGALSSRATVETLTIADGEGIWLRAEGLALDWNRTALLRGRLDITELTADSIEILRPPVPDPAANPVTPEARPFSLPDLPVSIRIDDLSAGRILLGAPLLGEEIELSLDGSVQLDGGEGTATIAADRIDGGTGHFEIAASYSNETKVLDVNADLTEGEGGLIARALDLPGQPSIDLQIEGNGPLSDFDATLALATDGEERVTGALQLVQDGADGAAATTRVRLDLDGDVTPLISPVYGEFFGNDIALRVLVTNEADGRIVLDELQIDTQALSLGGTAVIAAGGWPERIDLSGTFGAADGTPVTLPVPGGATRVTSADLEVTFDASEDEAWTLRFDARDFQRPGIAIPVLTLDGGGVLIPPEGDQPGGFTADVDYAAEGLSFTDPALSEAVGAEVGGNLLLARDAGGPFRITGFSLEGPGVELSAEGTVQGPDSGFETQSTVTLTAEDIGRFAALTGLDAAGAADVVIVSTVRPLDGAFDLNVTGTTQDLALGIAQVDPLIDGTGTIGIAATRDEAGTRVDGLSIRTPEVEATGSANLTSTGSTATFDVAIEDVGVSLDGLTGRGTLRGTANRNEAGATVIDVALRLPGSSADIDATLAPEDQGGGISGAVSAMVEDLAPFAEIVGRPLEGAISMTVEGALARDLSTFDLTLAGTTRDLVVGVPQADALLQGDGRIDGRVARTGPESFLVEDFRVATPGAQVNATGTIDAGVGSVEFDARLAELSGLLPRFSGAATANGTVSTVEDGSVTLNLSATGPGEMTADIDATLSQPSMAGTVEGRVALSAADIAPYSELAGRPLDGAVTATVAGTAELDLATFDVTIDATTDTLQFGVPQADALLQGEGRVAGRVARSGPDSFAVDGLSVRTAAVQATATGTIDGGVGEVELDARIVDLSDVLPQLSGAASATGSVAMVEGGAVTLDLTATGPGGAEAIVDATLSSVSLQATADGMVTLRADDISPYAAVAGRDLDGGLDAAVTGTAQLTGDTFDLGIDASTRSLAIGIPQVDAILQGNGTITGQVTRTGALSGSVDGLRIATPALQANVDGSYEDGVGDADFDIRLADIGTLAPGFSGPLTATGTAARDASGAVTADIDATGPGGASFALTANGTPGQGGTPVATTLRVDVQNLAPYGAALGRQLSGGVTADIGGTVQPEGLLFDLTVDAETRGLDIGVPAVARILAGSGTIDGRVVRDGADSYRVEGLQVSYPNLSVSGSLNASGGGGSADFDARLADIGLFVPEFSGPVTADGSASLSPGGGWTVNTDVTGPGGTAARIDGTVGSGGTLNLGVTGSAPLGFANGFIAPRRLNGTAAFDLRVDGPPALSSVSGTVSIAEGRLADPGLSQAIEGISGTITLGGNRAEVAIAGSLDSGGQIRVSGPVALSGGYDATLRIEGQGLVLRDPSLYEATANVAVTVTGPLTGGARIEGLVEVPEAEIQVPSSGIGALGDLPPVQHVGESGAVDQTLARAGLTTQGTDAAAGGSSGGGARPYPLDITIRAPERIFIRGRGLDAELGGELRISGTTAQVIPSGGFELIRGRLDILQQRFDLTEGRVTLEGDFVPVLRLVAETTAPTGTVVRIIVEGPADDPEVRFESTPDLPQDEVLAQLIFGRDLSSISPLQAVQLAAAVGTLAGQGGGGLINDFRSGLGLDDLDITTDEGGNAAVRAGKYLTDNVYADVTLGDETSINLNLDVTDDITVRGSSTSEGNTSLGIFYERDY